VQPTSFEHAGRLIDEALTAARMLLKPRRSGRHLRLVSRAEGSSSRPDGGSRTSVRVPRKTAEGATTMYERTEAM
jgi:hypothetical protein